MIEKKHLLKLALISVAAVTVGAAIGLVLNYQTIKELREEPSAPSMLSGQVEEEKEEEKIATYSGTIKPVGKLYSGATHYLEDRDGQMTILLESGKIDLSFVEGQTVEVEGKVKKNVEGEKQILEVERVRF